MLYKLKCTLAVMKSISNFQFEWTEINYKFDNIDLMVSMYIIIFQNECHINMHVETMSDERMIKGFIMKSKR